ncbi:flagellar biosynthetic protein FliO [Longirhabdus pacifica]|uniref:flagellar biosynthetic protein FliO n=1 Tax=Longirhabdus pacifica TaxID=2305227 RepID=UPI001008A2BC|nr:flagellar biosynthetic protein FliO [Longirhabdus pacifica]
MTSMTSKYTSGWFLTGYKADYASDGWMSFLYVIGTLIFIIFLFLIIIRFIHKKRSFWLPKSPIQSLGALSVAPQKTIQIIELGEVIYVIGVGDDITVLDKLSESEQVEKIREQLASPSSKTQAYSFFEQWRKRNEKRNSNATTNDQHFQDMMEEELSRNQHKNQ